MTSVSWATGADLDMAEWVQYGKRIGSIGRGSGWWIGDWLRYGNARFGERYARAARITGYDVQTLMNMVYVASRIEISRRREKLSWSHHAEVAAGEIDEQEYWLERAEQERMSVRDLRTEIRGARRSHTEAPETSRSANSQRGSNITDPIVCPECGYRFAPGAT